ncbi:MAG: hypothetical protein A2074_07045 [Candidatus Aquicultor primus]|uniref:Uncharacterized protein n=1 Tax=Candidatus Aquicultor primus TaxID=1797195 RepID=A0A1F2URZ4_9ACTN|nr:MAG: hypothetical protein A2074_07045 [Candidatus Aquicultor primus]HCG99410.1 hypothetical protein [Actinomycetota bacterium]
MNSKIVMLVLLAMVLLLMIAGISYAISPNEQAQIIAEEEFPKLLKDVIEPNNEGVGFPDKDQYENVSLGEPLEHYEIDFDSFDPDKGIDEQSKQNLFYTFPVMLDDSASIGFTVGVQANGEWEVIDVGGGLNKTVSQMADEQGLSNSRVLHFAGAMLIVATRDDKVVGYAPYYPYEPDLKEKTVVSEDEIMKILVYRHKEFQELIKNGNPQGLLGGPGLAAASAGHKQEGVIKRLTRFVKHVL